MEKSDQEILIPKENHLKEGVHPIMTSIGTFAEHSKGRVLAFEDFIHEIDPEGNSYKVNFYSSQREVAEKKFKNAGPLTYVISAIDDKNKFSHEYHDCTGLVATGTEKETGKEISFLSHQNAKRILTERLPDFVSDLKERLHELKKRCQEGTIDVIIIGGKTARPLIAAEYREMTNHLNEVVEQELGFQPAVVGGPKLKYYSDGDTVFLDTGHRRLYLLRNDSES